MIFVQTRSGDMWTTEHSIETSVDAQAIWRAWADVPGWPEWNGDIEHVELTGSFATGSVIAMTPHGQDPVHLRVADVIEGEQFIDEADVAGTVVRTTHRIEAFDEHRVRVVYRLEASGPAAEEIGPAISADFDETLRALVEHAGR
jgi:Polyketide cyclase / dehydrase and lipid transport